MSLNKSSLTFFCALFSVFLLSHPKANAVVIKPDGCKLCYERKVLIGYSYKSIRVGRRLTYPIEDPARPGHQKIIPIPPGTRPFDRLDMYLPVYDVKVDPAGITEFSIKFLFDPELYVLNEISIPANFTQQNSPDLSKIDFGIVSGIHGSVNGGEPFSGIIMTASISELYPEFTNGNYSFSLEDGGFVNGIDADGNAFSVTGNGSIEPCPVPAPLSILGLGAAYSATRRLRTKTKQLKSK